MALKHGQTGTKNINAALAEAALLGSIETAKDVAVAAVEAAETASVAAVEAAKELASTDVAGMPSAAANEGKIMHFSDGADGSPCLAYSNGTNWLRITLGAAVSDGA